MYACMHEYIYMHACVHASMYVCDACCTHMCTCVCEMRVCVHVCVHCLFTYWFYVPCLTPIPLVRTRFDSSCIFSTMLPPSLSLSAESSSDNLSLLQEALVVFREIRRGHQGQGSTPEDDFHLNCEMMAALLFLQNTEAEQYLSDFPTEVCN